MANHPYLIVGAGMAGLTLAWQLRRKHIPFRMVHHPGTQPSTPVAAGMFSPLGGKRFQLNTFAEKKLSDLHEFFSDMEQWLGKQYLVGAPVIQAFGNTKETNDFFSRMDDPRFRKYVDPEPHFKSPMQTPHGAYATLSSGWAKTEMLLADSHQQLISEGLLFLDQVKHEDLKQHAEGWLWKDNIYAGIIFCDGYGLKDNPWFSWVPFKWCKGQVLLIRSKTLVPDEIIKRSVYIVHQSDDLFKVGATYEWNFDHVMPTEEGRVFLEDKLKELGDFDYEVVKQYAAVRPASRDRNPILGSHPEAKGLYIYNGLGAKGVLQGPFSAVLFANWLIDGQPIPSNLSIERFHDFYTIGQQAKQV